MEADLLRFYRVDLADLFTGRLTWRRLRVLIAGLPPEAATVRALLGDAAHWGVSDYLLALIADLLNVGNWQRGNPRKTSKPKPIPRPGARRALGNRSLTPEQFDRLMQQHQALAQQDRVEIIE